MWTQKNNKKLGIPILCTKNDPKFWELHVFSTIATENVLTFLGIPNDKCG